MMKKFITIIIIYFFLLSVMGDTNKVDKPNLKFQTNKISHNVLITTTNKLGSNIIVSTNTSPTVVVSKPFSFPPIKKPIPIKYSIGGMPPKILSPAYSLIVTQGNKVILSPNISSTNVVNYQWFKSGSKISGATKSSLTITNVQTANKGLYVLNVTNSFGSSQILYTLTILTTNILTECQTGTSSVILGWDYDYTNNSSVSGFKIYDGILSNVYTNIVFVDGKTNNGYVKGLTNGITYYFSMTAKDTNNLESIHSSEIFYLPVAPIKQFSLEIGILLNGVPRLQIKVCPGQVINFQYVDILQSSPFSQLWKPLVTVVADQYGNVIYDDSDLSRGPNRIYRASTF